MANKIQVTLGFTGISLADSIIEGGLNLRRLANLRLRSESDLFPKLLLGGFFTM